MIVGRILAPLWLPAAVAAMYFGRRWRLANAAETRREYRRLLSESRAPLLVCANHLTLVDSALIAWSLGSWWWYLLHFSTLPWNLPERANFTRSIWQRVAVYLMKCLPITRGGERGEVADVLAQFTALLASGEVGLLFPEGGRSRTGRIDLEAATYGVGRVVKALPGCRVLCVYLRGEKQADWSELPARDDVFHASLSCFTPHSERAGLRGSMEIGQQILSHLDQMEKRYFEEQAA